MANIRNGRTKNCPVCGKEFYLSASQLATKFCSRACYETTRANTTLTCTICGNEFYCSKSQQTLRSRKTCSKECQAKLQSTKIVGSSTKGKDRKGLVHKAQKLANQYARLRDADHQGGAHCISCGTYYPVARMHGGHFIPTTYSATRFESTNIHAQCVSCNLFHHGNQLKYMLAMEKKYGRDHVNDLLERSNVPKKWTVPELEQIIEDYQRSLKELTSERGD